MDYGRTESEHVEFSNRADAAAVLDEVGEVSAHVVGLSRGGHIALDFALEYPTRTRSLTVAAGGVGGYESPSTSTVDWDEVEAWEDSQGLGPAHRVRNRVLGRRTGSTT